MLEIGPARTKEDPEPRKTGFEIELELPLFDWGGAKVAQGRGDLHAVGAAASPRRPSTRAREVREAYSAYRDRVSTLARHYRDEIVPLRKRISEEKLLRYNGMLISVFELLADAREQVASVNAAIEALRDFWTRRDRSAGGADRRRPARTGGDARAAAMHRDAGARAGH